MLERKVKKDGFEIIEAGVGYANLAAWLAVSKLQIDDGIPVELVAEIGLYGFMPQPGEPFIFANRNLASAKSFTTAFGVLGQFVGSRHNNCLSIIGAAQIDAEGNINSTYSDDGRFLVGSGGANDINSASREVVAITQQSLKRLVTTLPYITSPGRLVSTLVTDFGIFEKRNGRFALTGIFPQDGLSQFQIVEKIRAGCEWSFEVGETLHPEPVPTREELIRLRLFDPRNDFLNGKKIHHEFEQNSFPCEDANGDPERRYHHGAGTQPSRGSDRQDRYRRPVLPGSYGEVAAACRSRN